MERNKVYTDFHRAFAIVNEKEDGKYSHIGMGRYKLKGKEFDLDAEIFVKDKEGNYKSTKGTDAAKGGDGAAANTTTKDRVLLT